jgi:MoxR-like ATPase
MSQDETGFARSYAHRLRDTISQVVVGQGQLVELLTIAFFCRGHALLEGPPGVAKTLVAKAFCHALGLGFSRVQFTPDLLPSDIIGTPLWHPGQQQFEFRKGKIFTDLLLADEINRAPAKVQSALLEAMQERQVTTGQGTTALSPWFTVLATQNPLEHEGTYPLPEAQKDRFMFQILVDYPTRAEELEISRRLPGEPSGLSMPQAPQDPAAMARISESIERTHLAPELAAYAVDLVRATRGGALTMGASPRASIDLVRGSKCRALLAGRDHVLPEDIATLAVPVLAHRVQVGYEAIAANKGARQLIQELVQRQPAP